MPLTLRHLDAGPPRSSHYNRARPIWVTGDQLGFILAPVYPGWYVIPLTDYVPVPPLVRNGQPVTQTTRLAFGDRLEIGDARFAVDSCTAGDDDAVGAPHVPTATVLVRSGNQTVANVEVQRPAVVGSDTRAAVTVSAETGLAPHHAVVAHVADRWHLFVLEKNGASRFGSEPVHEIALVPGEAVWLTDRVELTLNCAELDPLDLIARTARASAPELRLPSPVLPIAPVTRAAEETPVSVSLGKGSGADPRRRRVRSDPNNAAHRTARALCERLQAIHLGREPRTPRPHVSAAPFRSLPLPGGTAAEVDQLAAELADDPWVPDTLFAFAALLRRLGLDEFGAWVLAGLRRRNPTDAVVNQSYGVLCLEQATNPKLAPEGRNALLGRARRYLAAALDVRDQDSELVDLLQKAGADLTVPQLP